MLVMGIISQAAQVNNKLTADTEDFPVSPRAPYLQAADIQLAPSFCSLHKVLNKRRIADVSQLLMAMTKSWSPVPCVCSRLHCGTDGLTLCNFKSR